MSTAGAAIARRFSWPGRPRNVITTAGTSTVVRDTPERVLIEAKEKAGTGWIRRGYIKK
jgi:hypothetical protein